MKARLSRLVASRAFIVVAAVLAVVLLLPTLSVGFMMDDYGQLLWLRGTSHPAGSAHGVWDLFRFQDADHARLTTKLDLGFWPWWTSPDLRIAFLRPLTSLTHAFDHWLFPDSAALMRLESALMYGGVVVVVGLLYRRMMGATVAAGLAILMYALDDAHAITASWISNRNAVLAGALGFLALYLFDRGARDGERRAKIAAPIVFGVALLAGEAAMATLGYLAAHALWMQKEPWKKRALGVVPFVGVAAVWSVVYKLGGYGAWGGEFYIDPGKEPVRFLEALVQRLPVLLHGQFAFPPSDVWMLVPFEKQWTVWAIVMVVVLLGVTVLAFGLRKTKENAFFATGMLLALVPVCATWPGDRLLIFAGFGAFGLIGDFLTAPREGLGQGRRIAVKGAAGFFVLLHLILAPVFYLGRTFQLDHMLHDPIERADQSLPPAAELAGKTLVVVNGPDVLIPLYGVVARERRGEPSPGHLRQLAIATQGRVMLRRTGERTVELTLTKGFFHEPFSLVFRMADKPFALGDRVQVPGMTATAKAYTSDRKRIGTVEFEFEAPLSDSKFVWVVWRETKFEALELPGVGEEVEIPAIDYQKALQGA